ncbi:unnamed protein product [Camellia sinensis]
MNRWQDKRQLQLDPPWTALSTISEPLQASITGAPLEDARYLTHRYDRLRQEVETQVLFDSTSGYIWWYCFEVIKRQSKCKDPSTSAEISIKLQNVERKLNELRSALMALGRVAITAMLSMEDQQQMITFQKLLTMVFSEAKENFKFLWSASESPAERG